MKRFPGMILTTLLLFGVGCTAPTARVSVGKISKINWPWSVRLPESMKPKESSRNSSVASYRRLDEADSLNEPQHRSTAGIESGSKNERLILPVAHNEDESQRESNEPLATGRSGIGLSRQLTRETFPVDLATVVRLVNDNSPVIGYSRARVAEAQVRAEAANLLWLPNLSAGVAYNRYDGQTQNQSGNVFAVSRSNLFSNGGIALNLDFAEAIYRPLIEQRVAAAEQFRANSTSLAAELDAVLAYLDLVQSHGLIEINSQALEKGETLLVAARNAQEAKLDRSPGDINRVKTEILLRRQERLELMGRSNVASTRLGKLLMLRSSVRLVPVNSDIVPITLVKTDQASLDDLVSTALQFRPDIASNRELLAAAWERVRKAQRGPLLPKLQATDQGGNFGGGINSTIGEYQGRNVLTGVLYWELKNLGFGNQNEVSERRAGAEQAQYQLLETQAKLSAEVVEAVQIADAKLQILDLAEEAVKEASELYRINQEGTFNLVDAKNLFDALRPLQSLQMLQQTRQNYLAAIVDYNRAQYRLYAAIGCPHANVMP